jgi:hypothetical protein
MASMSFRTARLLRGFVRAALIAALALCLAPAPPEVLAAGEKRILVQGRLLDDKGAPLAGWPVSLIRTKRYVELTRKVIGGDVDLAARVQADKDGFFTIDIPRERGYQFYYLRFLDPEVFDPVQYVAPADWEITSTAKRGRLTQINKVIAHTPDWDELQRRLESVGGETTTRGRVLRTIGLPEKTATTSDGAEEWWYFSRGIMYTFRGDQPVGEQRFEPVVSAAAPPAGC